MIEKKRPGPKRAFVIAFIVLTSLCWCPWAYGTLTGRVLAIPSWAVVAYVCAAGLFALEWVFLFFSGLAVSDEDLAGIISDLEGVDTTGQAANEEGE